MRTLTEQYRSIKEGKGPKDVFLKEAKRQFPNLVTNKATFGEASTILKQKGIISENYVDLKPINNVIERKKEGYEDAFAKFLAEAEAKAEEKKVSKEVEEDAAKNYDYKDKKNPDNMIFGQIQMGYYFEMKQEKNADKTIDEIKDIVFKNLAKDPIYYTKNGQFGVDVGYTDEAPSLGEPEEPKGEYKSSGYGKLKENKMLKENKISKIELVQKQIKHLKSVIANAGLMAYYGQQGSGQFSSHRDDMDSPYVKGMEKEIKELEQDLIKLKKDPKNNEKTVLVKPDGTVEPINEIAIAGGIVAGGGFTSANYMDFYGLNEITKEESDEIAANMKSAEESAEKIASLEEDEAPAHIERLLDAVEVAYDAGMDVKEIMDMIEQHLGLKMGE